MASPNDSKSVLTQDFGQSSLHSGEVSDSPQKLEGHSPPEKSVKVFLVYQSGWEGPVSNLLPVFLNGGPQVLIWGLVIVWVGALAQSASLAEMASITPIAGAQYHVGLVSMQWTAAFAPRKCHKFITWIQGEIPSFPTTTAADDQSLDDLGRMGRSTRFSTKRRNKFDPRHCYTKLSRIYIRIMANLANHDVLALVPLHHQHFSLLDRSDKKASADFVFFHRVDSPTTSGWPTNAVSWHLGLLTPIYIFSGFDAGVNLSEETCKARMAVPRVIFWNIVACGFFAIPMAIVTLFSAGDLISTVLKSPFPFIEICAHVTGSRVLATWMGIGLIFIGIGCSLGTFLSASRLTWAWARDGGFGRASPWIAEVNSRQIPARAVTVASLSAAVIALPNIKSKLIFAAMTSLATLALYMSYALAISCMLLNRFGLGSQTKRLGQWNWGRLGPFINAYAIVHSLYMIFWLPWPSTLPVSAQNMNWAGPVVGFILLIVGGVYPFVKNTWPGIDEVHVEKVVNELS
ncbi:amino acid permease-domain-containing protein [Phyllosticta capitalensis]|uniref:Amino acid permease-domain-containing protein n=1 Tax=Phyllosticta capitalensis TaxID=121624 RepID=A0ABR1YEU8_9PEZI